jgi:hypothetical protein
VEKILQENCIMEEDKLIMKYFKNNWEKKEDSEKCWRFKLNL